MGTFVGLVSDLKRAQPTSKRPAAAKKTAPKAGVPVVDQSYLGNRVRELREAAGMTQIELALKAQMSQTRIPDIEAGRRDVHISTVRKLARAFGVRLQDLLPPN